MRIMSAICIPLLACVLQVWEAAAADAPNQTRAMPEAPVSEDICQGFGPKFFKTSFSSFCAKIGYDIRASFNKDFAKTDIEIASLRLPTAANPAGGIPFLGYFSRDFSARTAPVRPSLDAQINLTVAKETDFGPLVAFANLHGAASLIVSASPVIESNVNQRGAAQSIVDQAWVKIAGFTLGVYPSFFNFMQSGYSYSGAYSSTRKTPLIGYSKIIGSNAGVSVSLEDPRRRNTFEGVVARYAAARIPDVVATARVANQSALLQVSGAYHQIRDRAASDCCAVTGRTAHGFAGLVGGEYKTKWSEHFGGAAGDMYGRFMATFAYSRGALNYLSIPYFAVDYLAEENGQLRLTKGWSAVAAYEHLWTPTLKSTFTYSHYRTGMSSNVSDLAAGIPGMPFVPINFNYNVRGNLYKFGTEYMLDPTLMIGAELSYFSDRVAGSNAGIPGVPLAKKSTNALVYIRKVN